MAARSPQPSKHPLDEPELIERMSPSLRALARKGELRRYPKGRLLIQEGEIGDTIYILLAGQLQVSSVSADSGREIFFVTLQPGEYAGEMGLDGGARSANVAVTVAALCAVVDRATLMQHLESDPRFAVELLCKVIDRARATTEQARLLALETVYGRLRAFLHRQARTQPDGSEIISPRPTHQHIANHIGCTREMVTRLLRDLRSGGYLEERKDALVLRRPPERW